MLNIGDLFPDFTGKAVISSESKPVFIDLSQTDYQNKWAVYFFWPKDFTFVCPTEIAEFGKLNRDFCERDAQILGISTDSDYVHFAWKQQNDELRNLPFPMFSDITRELSLKLGILDQKNGVSHRATFIVDPNNVIRFVMVTDQNVGRNPKEVLRILDALQTDELCPCNWQKGERTLTEAVQ
jgi:lipoyl-dependent peroxiredoxin subunit C